jgi:hypothetical protein
MFRTFDFASPDTTSAQRFQTTVPQQALYFMNSPFALDQVRRFAGRPEVVEAGSMEARVERMYGIVFQRRPTPEEVEMARVFVGGVAAGEGSGAGGASERLSRWERYGQALLMANEAVFFD